MVTTVLTDEHTGQPLLSSDGTPRRKTYIGLAIAKMGETEWRQTPWGALIYQEGITGYSNNETLRPNFSWKIDDGDSNIPNNNGKVPNQREGWPGHWILHMSTELPVQNYHRGRLEPIHMIQNKNEIKVGDYIRVLVQVKANGSSAQPAKTPGVYLNPTKVELYSPGQAIVLDGGMSAAEAFAAPAQLPPGALVDTAIATPAPVSTTPTPPAVAPAAPATDFLNPAPPPPAAAAPKLYNVNGQQYTAAQLLAAKWTQAQIDALGQ